jgi:integrase
MIDTYIYEKKKCYLIHISYTSKSGKRFQRKYRKDRSLKRITSEALARRLELEYLLELKDEVDDDTLKITFREWHQTFLEKIKFTHKLGTIMQYDGDLKKWLPPSLQDTPLINVTRDTIFELIHEHLPAEGSTPHTQKRICKNIRRILESAVDEGLISRNPAKGLTIKVPSSKKLVLNASEAQTLLREARAGDHVFYHVWAFALFTGMRSGELIGLRWSDIDEVSGNIVISRQWTSKDGYHTTKSNKTRILPLSNELKSLLIELKSMGPYSANFNVTGEERIHVTDLVLPRIKEWRDGQQAAVLRGFLRLINVREVKFHDLRATFITNLLSQGVSIAKVMSLVGHSKISTTDEYLRLAGIDTKGSTDQLGYSLPKFYSKNVIALN